MARDKMRQDETTRCNACTHERLHLGLLVGNPLLDRLDLRHGVLSQERAQKKSACQTRHDEKKDTLLLCMHAMGPKNNLLLPSHGERDERKLRSDADRSVCAA